MLGSRPQVAPRVPEGAARAIESLLPLLDTLPTVLPVDYIATILIGVLHRHRDDFPTSISICCFAGKDEQERAPCRIVDALGKVPILAQAICNAS